MYTGVHTACVAALLGLTMSTGCRLALTAQDLADGELGTCVEGRHMDGDARFAACAPENWNGDLLVWAHGYRSPLVEPEPLIHDDELARGLTVSEVALGLGYGWATTSYSEAGLVVEQAVHDLEDVVERFERRFGVEVDRAYLLGGSEGGYVTALSMEKTDTPFDGGLAACAPTGSLQGQVDYVGDVRVLFDWFFPDVLPGDVLSSPPEVAERWDEVYEPAILEALAADPEAARALREVADIPDSTLSPQAADEAIAGLLWYNVFGKDDLLERLGGNPYSNVGHTYSGSGDDARLNEEVERFEADPEARLALRELETTGELRREVVQLQSLVDPIIPYWQSTIYRAKVDLADESDRYVRQSSLFYGHCTFPLPEVLVAFGTLTFEVEGAELVVPEWMFADDRERSAFERAAAERGLSPRVIRSR